jgi:hypothetical protein
LAYPDARRDSAHGGVGLLVGGVDELLEVLVGDAHGRAQDQPAHHEAGERIQQRKPEHVATHATQRHLPRRFHPQYFVTRTGVI